MNERVREFRRNIIFPVGKKREADTVIFMLNESMSTAGRSRIIKLCLTCVHRKMSKNRYEINLFLKSICV